MSDHFSSEILKVCAISAREQGMFPPLDTAEALIRGGATMLILREKDLSPRELFELANSLRGLCTSNRIPFLVNGSVEVALAVNADGVHLGHTALSPQISRRLMGPDAIIGVSSHDIEDIETAKSQGADYVFYSPIYEPTSKKNASTPKGTEALTDACALGIPVVALGGITTENAAECKEAGAAGIAAIGALWNAPNPQRSAAAFRRIFDN